MENQVSVEQQTKTAGCNGDDEEKEAKSLNYQDLAGLFVVMAFFFAVTYVVWAAKKFQQRHMPRLGRWEAGSQRELGSTERKTTILHTKELEEAVHDKAAQVLEKMEKMDVLNWIEKSLNGSAGSFEGQPASQEATPQNLLAVE